MNAQEPMDYITPEEYVYAPSKKKKVPSIKTIERWFMDGYCKTPDGCKVEPDGTCPHGQESWMLILELI